MELAVLWIVLGVVLAIAEIFTVTLLLLTFSVGAFAAAVAAALGAGGSVQVLLFAAVSAFSLFAVRPLARRHRGPTALSDEVAFGVAALEGSSAMVLEQVDTDHGKVKIDGELWTARSFDGAESFAPGERVRIVQVRGTTVYVWHDDTPYSGT